MNNRTGTVGTESSPHNFSTHAHVYNKVEEEKSESEELLEGSAPHPPLPTLCRQIPIALHAILHCSSGSLGQGSTITHPPARYAYPR